MKVTLSIKRWIKWMYSCCFVAGGVLHGEDAGMMMIWQLPKYDFEMFLVIMILMMMIIMMLWCYDDHDLRSRCIAWERKTKASNLLFFNQIKMKQMLKLSSSPYRWVRWSIDSTEIGGATIRLLSYLGLWLPTSCRSPLSRFLIEMERSSPLELLQYPDRWMLLLNSSWRILGLSFLYPVCRQGDHWWCWSVPYLGGGLGRLGRGKGNTWLWSAGSNHHPSPPPLPLQSRGRIAASGHDPSTSCFPRPPLQPPRPLLYLRQ